MIHAPDTRGATSPVAHGHLAEPSFAAAARTPELVHTLGGRLSVTWQIAAVIRFAAPPTAWVISEDGSDNAAAICA